MIVSLELKNEIFKIDLSKALDISIALNGEGNNLIAWGLEFPIIEPYKQDDFIGKVAEGASVNFNNISFNPHGHMTHTECVGHITENFYSINKELTEFFFLAQLITIAPEKFQKDLVISKKQLQYALGDKRPTALVIRTLPNLREKLHRKYSKTNPPYLLEEAALFLSEIGVEHLLIDLPSVDKEDDKGALLAHRAFWGMDTVMRRNASITELIYVRNEIIDGSYLLNLQVAPIENDASPSRPVLYSLVRG